MALKSAVFWDMTPCSPLNVNRRFWGTFRLNLQGRRISQARNQANSACYLFQTGFLITLFLDLKLEALYSSETVVDFQRTSLRRYISEDI
jgi:hypothetical protein